MPKQSMELEVTRRFVDERIVRNTTGLALSTLRNKRSMGESPFPYYKLGRAIRYDLDEVISIMQAHKIEAAK